MATTERMGVDPLAVIRAHAESHRSLAAADAYSAQEAPKLEAALAVVAELAAKANKVAVWLGRSALIADANALDTRFPSLAEAFSADAKNYRAIEADLRVALSPFSEAGR